MSSKPARKMFSGNAGKRFSSKGTNRLTRNANVWRTANPDGVAVPEIDVHSQVWMHSILILGNLTDSLPAMSFSCAAAAPENNQIGTFLEKAGQNIDWAGTGGAKEV